MREKCHKIPCIEDNHETAELIAEEFVDRGFDVQVTYDGPEGYSTIVKSITRVVRYQHAHLIGLRADDFVTNRSILMFLRPLSVRALQALPAMRYGRSSST